VQSFLHSALKTRQKSRIVRGITVACVWVKISEGGIAMKILLAIDGSPYSEAAAKSVASRPWPANSEVKIISVIEPLQPYGPEVWAVPAKYWGDLEKSAEQQSGQLIEMTAKPFNDPQRLRITKEVFRGNPKAVIVDEAKTWGADLIVMGSHGYTGLKRLLLGSVSQAVLSQAPCSVEIIRSRASN
jgi:nucleotide-binding universal stress UspA family protein